MMTLPVYVYRQYAQGLVPCAEGDAACIPDINSSAPGPPPSRCSSS